MKTRWFFVVAFGVFAGLALAWTQNNLGLVINGKAVPGKTLAVKGQT